MKKEGKMNEWFSTSLSEARGESNWSHEYLNAIIKTIEFRESFKLRRFCSKTFSDKQLFGYSLDFIVLKHQFPAHRFKILSTFGGAVFSPIR